MTRPAITLTKTTSYSFYWAIDTEADYDWGFYCIHSGSVAGTCTKSYNTNGWSGYDGYWHQTTVTLSPGTYVMQFGVQGDGSGTAGYDHFLVDYVRFNDTGAMSLSSGETTRRIEEGDPMFSLLQMKYGALEHGSGEVTRQSSPGIVSLSKN
jgi:hypothetical protein